MYASLVYFFLYKITFYEVAKKNFTLLRRNLGHTSQASLCQDSAPFETYALRNSP